MSGPVDPPRLRADSALGGLVDEARRERLDEATRARAWRSIEIATVAAAAGAGAAKSGTLLGKLGALSLAKIGVAMLVVVLLLVGGGIAVVAGRAPTVTSNLAAPSPPAETAAPGPEAPTPATIPAPSASASSAPAPTPSTSPTALPAAPAGPSPSAPKGAPTLDEGRLLLDAKAALGSDPRRSLALTSEHAKAFPGSALGPERESIAIDALARLGQCGAVRARAQRFLAVFRASPHRGLVERLDAGCGG